MITSKMTRADVEAILDDGGNFIKAQVDLPVFAENFFEYGFQNSHKRFLRDEMEELLSNLELNARENGDEVCGAVMGKAVLLTFNRRQVVTDALSYLSRASEKGVKGAAAELCAWYAGRIITNDFEKFENADVGLDDCYDPTPEYPRTTFPNTVAECRRRLVYWLRKTSEDDFHDVQKSFSALSGSSFDIPKSWADGMKALEGFLDGDVARDRLAYAKSLIDGSDGEGASKRIAEGAKIVRELAEKADCLEAWKYMLECHERKIGPFKTNKFRRDANAAIARLVSHES